MISCCLQGLEKYFQLEHNFFTSLPDPVSLRERREEGGRLYFTHGTVHSHLSIEMESNLPPSISQVYQKMLDVREYQVGTDFMRYVQRHPQRREEPEDFHFEEYDPDLE